ncbi:MAG: hypothetical protein ACRD6B_13410, partial [Bryobacteraceae bacterium]
MEAERIVGLFDRERGSGALWTMAEFNEFAPRSLPESEIQSVRVLRSALFKQWFNVAPGGAIQLL